MLGKMGNVIKGLRVAAMVFAAVALAGALLGFIGLIQIGAPWWFGLVVAVILATPAFPLWRFRAGLEPALDLPDRIRSIPDLAMGLKNDVSSLVVSLDNAEEKPKSPVAFIRSARTIRSAITEFQGSDMVELAQTAATLSPAGLVSGAGACLFAFGSLFIGMLLLVAGGLLG